MSEAAKVIDIKKKSAPKARVEPIQPKDVVDVLRLYEASMREVPLQYPAIDEEPVEAIRSFMYQYLTTPGFVGVMARIGRKPVGQILALTQARPIGLPKVYSQIAVFWIDPAYRGTGISKQLAKSFIETCKKGGVHYWETWVDGPQKDLFEKYMKGSAKTVSYRLAGKFVLEG